MQQYGANGADGIRYAISTIGLYPTMAQALGQQEAVEQVKSALEWKVKYNRK